MLTTLDGVRRAGVDVAVIAPPEGPLAQELARRGVEVLPFVFRDSADRRLAQHQLREELARLLGRRRPSLLHANSLSMGRLSGPVAAELGLPSIAHLRDIIKLSAQAVADLNRHTRLLAVSEATRQFHIAGGLAADKTHVLYNGVDLDRFRARPKSGWLHRELGLPPHARLVGTIGQICLRKGQDVFAQAAAILADKLPDVHCAIIGERWSDKPESRRFEADLQEKGADPICRNGPKAGTDAQRWSSHKLDLSPFQSLAGRLHLVGFRNDVDLILNELCLLVHPARQEPLGRVLLEAAAAGVAIVATDVGGTPEIFPPHSESAQLVPPDDPQAMAAAALELLNSETVRTKLGAAARRRAEEAFAAERATAGLVEHYREVSPQRVTPITLFGRPRCGAGNTHGSPGESCRNRRPGLWGPGSFCQRCLRCVPSLAGCTSSA